MADTKELKKIKKIYGEKFKNLCRDMFPTILEQEGTLLDILKRKFAGNCSYLYEAITGNCLEAEFKELIYGEFEPESQKMVEVNKSPYEILSEKGYDLIECKTEEDIQSFKKYYAPDEVLCTIYNGGRLKTRDCFFAVKKDVDNIRRENFGTPDKSDEYSTSVLGIQFTRDSMSTVQIISRYNHTVNNPNCTLGNDLDNLAPGLSQSFGKLLKERGLRLTAFGKKGFNIPGYVLARDGRYYKYNMEENGIYYCPGNIIISDGEVNSIGEPERGIFADYFYVDFQNKTIDTIDYEIRDPFADAFENIEKIEVEKDSKSENKIIKVLLEDVKEPVIIEISEDNQIVRYENPNIVSIGDGFLKYNKKLEKLKLLNVQEIYDDFLHGNEALSELELPNVRFVCDKFLWRNKSLTSLRLPSLTETGDEFLAQNEILERIELPSLQKVRDEFLYRNKGLTKLSLPNLREGGSDFLFYNNDLSELELPELSEIETNFLYNNKAIKKLNLPNLGEVGHSFLAMNEEIDEVEIPYLRKTGNYFLNCNNKLKELVLYSLRQVGSSFLYRNKCLEELEAPDLEVAGEKFLACNESLNTLEIPKLPELKDKFKEILSRNKKEELIESIEAKRQIIEEQFAWIREYLKEKHQQEVKDIYQR